MRLSSNLSTTGKKRVPDLCADCISHSTSPCSSVKMEIVGWVCSSVVQCLPSMQEALGFTFKQRYTHIHTHTLSLSLILTHSFIPDILSQKAQSEATQPLFLIDPDLEISLPQIMMKQRHDYSSYAGKQLSAIRLENINILDSD
jgi:hypothetical protein